MSLIDQIVSSPELRAGIEIDYFEGRYRVQSEALGEKLIGVLNTGAAPSDEDSATCEAWVVEAEIFGEASYRQIRSRTADGQTLGYVFPITSLSPGSILEARIGSEFQGEDSSHRYAWKFANVATRALIELGVGNELVKKRFEELSSYQSLDSIFPQNCCVVVLHKPTLEATETTSSVVQFLMQEHGYYTRPNLTYQWSPTKDQVAVDDPINLGRPAAEILGLIDEFREFVSIGWRQAAPAAAFLLYFQVFEILMATVFAKSVERLIADQRVLSNPWILKERLIAVGAQKYQLRLLLNNCYSGPASLKVDLKEACLRVLKNTAELGAEDPNVADALYAVRNLVVHSQNKLTADGHRQLQDVSKAVHAILFRLSCSFSLDGVPEVEALNAQ